MPNKIDVYDSHNRPTGEHISIGTAIHDGTYHHGVSIVVVNTTGHVIVQKRSETMYMNPGQLDISCGGFVDHGETPEQSAVRELYEELGIRIHQQQLQLTRIYHKRVRIKHKNIYNRAFIYCYVVIVPAEGTQLKIQQSEVAWARFIPLTDARRLIRRHYLRHLGRLQPAYNFYARNLRDASKLVKSKLKSTSED